MAQNIELWQKFYKIQTDKINKLEFQQNIKGAIS